MRDRPILFKGEMVRAILAGRKTQTRRIIKPQPSDWTASHYANCQITAHDLEDHETGVKFGFGFEDEEQSWKAPCQPGDLLWVRETWRPMSDLSPLGVKIGCDVRELVKYKADNEPNSLPWKPSIYMPRWASRITLKVTSVRVERLNHISDDDCEREGIGLPFIAERRGELAQSRFRSLWESINGRGSWSANPWVWVIEFEVQK